MTELRDPSDISAVVYVNRGPYLSKLDNKTIFTDKNKLGSPQEMEIHSSINGFYRYGYVIMHDEIGIRESFVLTGNEVISIVYRSAGRDLSTSMPSIIHFNIFDIEEVAVDPNAYDARRFTGKFLKFHLIEAPFFLKYNDRSWTIAFGYDSGTSDNRMEINKIVENHFRKHLGILKDDPKTSLLEFNIAKMQTKLHFISPAWKTQKIFSYILQFAKDEDGAGNVKLFNTTNNQTGRTVVNLISLNQIIKSKLIPSVTFSLIDTTAIEGSSDIENSGNRPINQILSYKFLSYDITSVPTGLAGATLLNRSYEDSRHYKMYDNYKEINKNKKDTYISNYALWNETISNENSLQLYLGSLKKDEAKAYLSNVITKHKHQLKCEILTYVDENIYPGTKVLLNFPSGLASAATEHQSHLTDEQMTDIWIIEDIVDSYHLGKGVRKMICMKDSFFNIYKPVEYTDPVPKVQYIKVGG